MPSDPLEAHVWRETLNETLKALREIFTPILADAKAELQVRLDSFATMIVKYWEAERRGDKQAAIILGSIKRQTRLIVARYERKASEALKASLIAAIEGAVKIGFKLLLAALA